MKEKEKVKRFNAEVSDLKHSEQLVCDTCKGYGRKYAGLMLGYLSCPKCGL